MGLALLPFLIDAGMGRSWVRLLDLALLYVMLALGLTSLSATRACSISAMSRFMRWAPMSTPGLPVRIRAASAILGVLPLGAALAGLFGVLLGRPRCGCVADYLAIVTWVSAKSSAFS